MLNLEPFRATAERTSPSPRACRRTCGSWSPGRRPCPQRPVHRRRSTSWTKERSPCRANGRRTTPRIERASAHLPAAMQPPRARPCRRTREPRLDPEMPFAKSWSWAHAGREHTCPFEPHGRPLSWRGAQIRYRVQGHTPTSPPRTCAQQTTALCPLPLSRLPRGTKIRIEGLFHRLPQHGQYKKV